MRAATSAGANYEEACSAESRSDFIHKLQIALKETREAKYWLQLIERSGLSGKSNANSASILQEAGELANILAKSIVTARKGG